MLTYIWECVLSMWFASLGTKTICFSSFISIFVCCQCCCCCCWMFTKRYKNIYGYKTITSIFNYSFCTVAYLRNRNSTNFAVFTFFAIRFIDWWFLCNYNLFVKRKLWLYVFFYFWNSGLNMRTNLYIKQLTTGCEGWDTVLL